MERIVYGIALAVVIVFLLFAVCFAFLVNAISIIHIEKYIDEIEVKIKLKIDREQERIK